MFTTDAVMQMIQTHGLWLIFALAIIEGPIVTVIAAYVAGLSTLNIYVVFWVLVVADLVGDLILYMVGRFGRGWIPQSWQKKLGFNGHRQDRLDSHFQRQGGRTLIIGKLTHSAGMFVLMASGASRMPVARFLFFNFIATLPKTLFFLMIGYSLGYAYKSIDSYIYRASLIVLVLLVVGGVIWIYRRRGKGAS